MTFVMRPTAQEIEDAQFFHIECSAEFSMVLLQEMPLKFLGSEWGWFLI